MKTLYNVSFVLLVIGGLNWLLEGFNLNLVDSLFGAGSTLSKVVYIVVGLATLVVLFTHKSNCSHVQSAPSQM